MEFIQNKSLGIAHKHTTFQGLARVLEFSTWGAHNSLFIMQHSYSQILEFVTWLFTLLPFYKPLGFSPGHLQAPGSHVQPGLVFRKDFPCPFQTKALEVSRMHCSAPTESSKRTVWSTLYMAVTK